jgi:nicotinamidase-related amidase
MVASRHSTIHGGEPRQCKAALLLIDVINAMEFPKGQQLRKFAEPAARHIAALKKRAKRHGVPAIYANDNFGRWRSDFTKQVRHCLEDGVLGESVARLLMPDEEDYFVLKPRHSAFFCTPLLLLLKHLGTETLILTGFATNLCVLYTAHDAYMHDFRVYIPRDCVAAEREQFHTAALAHMARDLKANTSVGSRIPLRQLLQ